VFTAVERERTEEIETFRRIVKTICYKTLTILLLFVEIIVFLLI